MKTIAALLVIISTVAPRSVWADGPAAAGKAGANCIAIVTPTVEGVSGSAVDAASGLRDLIAKYLKGPSLKVVSLEALLPSQAVGEAKQKACEPLLFVTLTRKSGGRGLAKALGQAAGASSWRVPYGGSAGSAAANAGAAGGLQAASSIAQSTKSKDEVRFEYRLQSASGQIQFGPKTETQRAKIDGEDLLTPVVARAAEAIVTRGVAK
jgi:hypothetical protein